MTTLTDHDEQGTGPEDRRAPAPAGRSLRRRTAAAAPAARFDPGRVAEPRHRNPTWLIAGILLVLLSALGGVLLFSSNDDRSEVLVAADDLEPGQPIERSDLRIERVAIDGGIASVDPADAAELIGRIPSGASRRAPCWRPGCSPTTSPSGPTRWSSVQPSIPARRRCRGCRSVRQSSC